MFWRRSGGEWGVLSCEVGLPSFCVRGVKVGRSQCAVGVFYASVWRGAAVCFMGSLLLCCWTCGGACGLQ